MIGTRLLLTTANLAWKALLLRDNMRIGIPVSIFNRSDSSRSPRIHYSELYLGNFDFRTSILQCNSFNLKNQVMMAVDPSLIDNMIPTTIGILPSNTGNSDPSIHVPTTSASGHAPSSLIGEHIVNQAANKKSLVKIQALTPNIEDRFLSVHLWNKTTL